MFVRIKTTPNSPRKSVQIVENIRAGGQVKQRIVRYVGIAMDDKEEEKLCDLGVEIIAKLTKERIDNSHQLSIFETSVEEIKKRIKEKKGRPLRKRIEDILPPNQVTLDDIVEQERIIEGIHEVGDVVYKGLGYDTILSKRGGRILKDIVLTRLAMPASKHKTEKILNKLFGKVHNLDSVYRMMDKLYERINHVKQCTFEHMRGLFPNNVDLVLFDVTTLYFESTDKDELRRFGYSKDFRFNTTQVVLALATNEDGLPIGYELFEGNKAEVKTLVESIEHWKEIFNIGGVCFIGDRAMFSRENLKLLDEKGYNYIVAAKLKSMTSSMKKNLVEEKNYRMTVLNRDLTWIGEFEYEGRRLIVSYKKRRALKDQEDRKRVLEKIEKLIGIKGQTKKLITNQGIKKYTRTDDSSQTVFDEEKITQDMLLDGFHGVITNIQDREAESIIARYGRLWIIEDSFRINKHLLKIRPIFHWKPKRIHAHIAMCYMAFAILRHLQYRVTLTQKISPEIIIEELLSVQSSIYIHKKTRDLYRVPGNFSNTARKIYKAFDISRSLDAAIFFH